MSIASTSVTSVSLQTWMSAVQASMEQALTAYLPRVDVTPAVLHQAMQYAVLGGGKRMRPLLVFAAGDVFAAAQDQLQRVAAALEMVHVYSLVHDDLPCMDDDALRRGKPTVHVAFDEATALLVGDALQAQAFFVLSADQRTTLAMVNLLAQAASSVGMCGGQAIDLASVGKNITLAELEHMHQLKTGALLRAAVLLGAMCGRQLSATEVNALEQYATAVGLAFQVIDDILDATADTATLGKTAGKDAMQNKPTYVSILGLDQSISLAEKLRQDAHAALHLFGDSAQRLRELADFIVQRRA